MFAHMNDQLFREVDYKKFQGVNGLMFKDMSCD